MLGTTIMGLATVFQESAKDLYGVMNVDLEDDRIVIRLPGVYVRLFLIAPNRGDYPFIDGEINIAQQRGYYLRGHHLLVNLWPEHINYMEPHSFTKVALQILNCVGIIVSDVKKNITNSELAVHGILEKAKVPAFRDDLDNATWSWKNRNGEYYA